MRAHLLFESGNVDKRDLAKKFKPRTSSSKVVSGAGARAGTGAGGSLLAFLLLKDLNYLKCLKDLKYLSWDWRRGLLAGFPPFERFTHKYRGGASQNRINWNIFGKRVHHTP